MSYLKKHFSVILFMLAFMITFQMINTVRIVRLVEMVNEFNPVVIERVQVVEVVKSEPVTVEPEVTPEPIPEVDVVSEPTPVITPEPVVTHLRINCRLDDETQQMIVEKCEEYDIDFAFAMAVIFKESSFRTNADSGSSVGLMQINRINHEWLSEELGLTDFFDPEQNVTAGLYILRSFFDKYEDPSLVLMAYNMGETGAGRLWKKGVYTSAYSEGVLQQADIYSREIEERMGKNDSM